MTINLLCVSQTFIFGHQYMSRKVRPRPRLTRAKWLETALEFLYEDGINAVTMDALAKRLEVTRGSFYHHFENRQDLFHEVLVFWKQKWTVDIREDVIALRMDGLESLAALANLIKHRGGAEYDIAVRAWAVHDDSAKATVAEADKIRLDFIREQFAKLGFEGLDLENRSRLYLYYAMTEPAFFDPPDDEVAHQLDAIRLKFLTHKN
jgi:AcrR family transcriptional regulator